MKAMLFALLALPVSFVPLPAANITQWTFNDTNAPASCPPPAFGEGSASLLGLISAGYVAGVTADKGATNEAWNTKSYPGTFVGNKTAGVQFFASTIGYYDISLNWYQQNSSTASRYARLQYTLDGSSFTDADVIAISKESSPTNITVSLASVPGATNNPFFGFRIVTEFASTATGSGPEGYVGTKAGSDYASGGTIHFDLVTVCGTPFPLANNPPAISGVPSQTLRVNQLTPALPFTVLDAEDPAVSLTVFKASSNPAVIPEENITLEGSGPSRTVTIQAGDQPGSSTITLTVSDLGGASASTNFSVTVLPANTAPSLSGLQGTNTLVNTIAPAVPFTVGDLETPAELLSLSACSACPSLVPNNPANLVFGGGGARRTLTLIPAPDQTGVAPITVTVSDGTNTATGAFALMVVPSPALICYESFAYPDGSLLTNSGLLWNHRSGSTVGECAVTNEQLQLTSSQSEDVSIPLIGAPFARNSGTVLYAAFKLRLMSLPKTTPAYFAHFGSGSTYRGRIYAATPTNSLPGALRLYVSNASDTNTVPAGDLNTNTWTTLVLRYDIDAASSSLWLNPASEADPPANALDSQTPVSISSFNFRQDSGYGASMLIDDLRVGFSFAAVTSTNSAPASIPLGVARDAARLILRWSNPSFVLQSASAVTGPYTNVPGATNPATNPITGPSKFFRLKLN